MTYLRYLMLSCVACACLTGHAAEGPLKVATKIAPPFVVDEGEGRLSGISVDIAERLAVDLGRELDWSVREDVPSLLQAVSDGEVELGISAITVTAEREALVDFSHPYYMTGLGVAVDDRHRSTWVALLASLVSPAFLTALGGLTAVLALAGLAVWVFERRSNPDFGGRPVEGLGSAFWWSAVTMTTVGYGDKAPRSVGGRVVALAWMFASIIIISGFTAAIASSLTIDGMGAKVQSIDDLPTAKAAVISGTFGAVDERLVVRTKVECEDLDEAFALLDASEVDAVIHDRPLLRYAIKGDRRPFRVLPGTIGRQDYAAVLPAQSPLREQFNRHLLALITEGTIRDLTEEHLQ